MLIRAWQHALTLQLGLQFMDASEVSKLFTEEEIRTLPDLWFSAARSVSPNVLDVCSCAETCRQCGPQTSWGHISWSTSRVSSC